MVNGLDLAEILKLLVEEIDVSVLHKQTFPRVILFIYLGR